MDRVIPVFFVAIYAVLWIVLAVLWVRTSIKIHKPNLGALSRFYITDIWAFMIGLLPSILVLSWVLDPKRMSRVEPIEVFCCAALFLSQLLGVVVVKAQTTPHQGDGRLSRWSRAWIVISGALMGLAFFGAPAIIGLFGWLAIAVIVMGTIYVVAAAIYVPIFGIPMLLGLVWIFWPRKDKYARRKSALKQPSPFTAAVPHDELKP
jgi:hypothetical protein